MNAHEEGEEHAKKNAAKREPEVARADGLVVGVEECAGEKARGGRLRQGRVDAALKLFTDR